MLLVVVALVFPEAVRLVRWLDSTVVVPAMFIGREGDIFPKVIGWSLGLLLLMCIIVGLQSPVLDWIVP